MISKSLPFGLQLKDWLYLSIISFYNLCLPYFAIISSGIYTLAAFATYFLPNYGKFIGFMDAWMDEDFVTAIPRNTIVTTLALDGDISLEELTSLFQKNVLESQCKDKLGKNRYPELKQYLTTFMGFRIWKNDPHFRIENHISEKSYQHYWNSNKGDLLGNIHEELLNLPYKKKQSPWEIILVREVPGDSVDLSENNNNNNGPSEMITLVACRLHHVMGDGKSVLKLLVEGLGKKKMTTASPQQIPQSVLDKAKFYLLFPLNFMGWVAYILGFIMPHCHLHPWKVTQYWKDKDVKTVVAFSPKLELAEIKKVAKENDVITSAVLTSIISGAIRNLLSEKWNKVVTTAYPCPKPDHPDMLTNHMYVTFLTLPTDQSDINKRLQECNKELLRAKLSQQGRLLNMSTVLGGSQMYPMSRLIENQFVPMGITNIAGEQEGFSVGSAECIDFRLTVGTDPGVAGVVISALSYKDGIRIGVNGKENVLRKEEAERLALDIAQEFKRLANSNI